MKVKITTYNKTKRCFEKTVLKKICIGTLPYRLAFEKFKKENGFSGSISFFNDGKIRNVFDEMYNY